MVLARRTELVQLTEASVAVALSVLLGNIRLVELPNGGSIALAVVPLLALALARGARAALLAGCCAGAAHALSGGTIIHPAQLGLDYFVSYAALALAGVGGPATVAASRRQLAPRILLAMSAHLAAMVVSGMVFFAPVAGDAAVAYSLAYNAATVVPEALLAILLVPSVIRSIARANPADAWRRGLLEPPATARRSARSIHARASIDTTDTLRRSPPSAAPTEAPRHRTTPLVRAAPFRELPSFSSLRLTRSVS